MRLQNQQARISTPTIVFILLSIILVAWLLLNKQLVIDTVRAYQYKPAAAVQSIESDLALTPGGKQLFAASQPKLESADMFNKSCNQKSETNNPILGCYVNQEIYVFDVTNEKLAGIEQTTAAHELLHAVYERLSPNDKRAVDTELEKVYESRKTEELAKRMLHYQETEPGEEMNELHSILGTEFDDVGEILEAHYAKFFTDRAKIVAFNKQYNDVFVGITKQLRQLTEAINASVDTINQRIKEHNQAVKQLESDQRAFVAKNRRGEFTNLAEFNAEQQALNVRAGSLNADRDQIAADIEASDELRDQYNSLVTQYNQLNQSINSSLAPKPSL